MKSLNHYGDTDTRQLVERLKDEKDIDAGQNKKIVEKIADRLSIT